jgi:drug/metabolite transporter (DMT)-like permease
VLSIALAAASGLIWGVGDFAGGKATQQANSLWVAFLSKLVALPLLAVYLIAMYAPPVAASLVWGSIAGVSGMIGLVIFYRALSAGAMTVVAPVTAVTSAAIPVFVGLARGEQPTTSQLVGVGCALAAIALISLVRPQPDRASVVTPRLLAAAVGAGFGFGGFFVFLAVAGEVAGNASLWPNVGSQVSAIVLAGLVIVARRPNGRPTGTSLRWTLAAGPFDMTANVLYLLATRHGPISVLAPLAALYPVSTVILALLVDRERLRAVQVVGLLLAVLTLVLVNV